MVRNRGCITIITTDNLARNRDAASRRTVRNSARKDRGCITITTTDNLARKRDVASRRTVRNLVRKDHGCITIITTDNLVRNRDAASRKTVRSLARKCTVAHSRGCNTGQARRISAASRTSRSGRMGVLNSVRSRVGRSRAGNFHIPMGGVSTKAG
jgi:hypothetical protein